MREIAFTPTALSQFKEWEQLNSKLFYKITELLDAARQKPFTDVGKPEPLKYNFKEYWSRSITRENSLVY
jgi:toxin YoeB